MLLLPNDIRRFESRKPECSKELWDAPFTLAFLGVHSKPGLGKQQTDVGSLEKASDLSTVKEHQRNAIRAWSLRGICLQGAM